MHVFECVLGSPSQPVTPLIVAAAAAVGEELDIGVFDKVGVLASEVSSIRVGPSELPLQYPQSCCQRIHISSV